MAVRVRVAGSGTLIAWKVPWPDVLLTEERLLSAVSPLGDMVGHARSYHTCQSSHGGELTRPELHFKSIGMVSPELRSQVVGGIGCIMMSGAAAGCQADRAR